MRSNTRMLLSVFLVAAIAGCGGSGDSSLADSAAEGADQVAPGKPDAAITVFLEAVRVGNDEAAAGMFTPLARKKVAELQIEVAPQGSDTASFMVGEVQYLAEDGAHVAATWTDLDENGKPRTEEMTWMVRRVSEGWRVAGMTTVVFPGEAPLLLDFEKPEELLHKLKWVREEVARRDKEANLQATKPQNPEDSFRQ